MAGLTWSKFFWADWRSDPGLRSCSLAARGLWMDLLCLAAESDPPGFILLNGRIPTTEEIARLVGTSEIEVDRLLAELSGAGVFSRDRRARMYSRRMVRDEKMRKTAVEYGKQGGNPSLRKLNEISDGVNPSETSVISLSRARAFHKPEASIHKPEESPHTPHRGAFDAWWSRYPHKVGKRAAETSYRRALARASPAELMDGLRRYIERKPPDRPWCNPATWLNQDRWTDQPAYSNGADHAESRRISVDGPTEPPPEGLLA